MNEQGKDKFFFFSRFPLSVASNSRQSTLRPTIKLYRVGLAPTREVYQIRLLFTHMNGVKDRSYESPILKVDRHRSERFSYTIRRVVDRYSVTLYK